MGLFRVGVGVIELGCFLRKNEILLHPKYHDYEIDTDMLCRKDVPVV